MTVQLHSLVYNIQMKAEIKDREILWDIYLAPGFTFFFEAKMHFFCLEFL